VSRPLDHRRAGSVGQDVASAASADLSPGKRSRTDALVMRKAKPGAPPEGRAADEEENRGDVEAPESDRGDPEAPESDRGDPEAPESDRGDPEAAAPAAAAPATAADDAGEAVAGPPEAAANEATEEREEQAPDTDEEPLDASDSDQAAIQRKADDGALDPFTGNALDSVRRQSSGEPLDAAVRSEMEPRFGADLSGVKVHRDGAAATAARGLNARAFTTGSDVYFGEGRYDTGSAPGKRLLAHEIAHVVQGENAAKGTGSGPQVSSPGDPAELAADRAADAVLEGRTVTPGDLGISSGANLFRDALGDLQSALGGDWLGRTDKADVRRRVDALSQADLDSIATGSSTTRNRLFSMFTSTAEVLWLIGKLDKMPLVERIKRLGRTSNVGTVPAARWRSLLALASPEEMAAIRADPTAQRIVVQHAPADLVSPWDRLQNLMSRTWNPTGAQLIETIEQLQLGQRQTVRGNVALMATIATRGLTAAEMFRLVVSLQCELKWAVYWLNAAGHIGSLGNSQWGQLLAEATPRELATARGWGAVNTLIETHCPEAIRTRIADTPRGGRDLRNQLTTQNVRAMLTELGPEGLLALATQDGADIAGNYRKVKRAGRVGRVIDGLAAGMAMGPRAQLGLRKWFFDAGENSVSLLSRMMGRRFNVTVGGQGGADHGSDVRLRSWTKASLQQMWVVLERLPPGQVEGSRSFDHLLRDRKSGNGEAYWWGADNSVVMGLKRNRELGDTTTDDVYGSGAADGSAVSMNVFNATLRHEIGHAVDDSLGFMNSHQGEAACGSWIKYGSYATWVQAIINAFPGSLSTTPSGPGSSVNATGYPVADVGNYRTAMINAAQNQTPFTDAIEAITPGAGARVPASPGGPVAVFMDASNYTEDGGDGPWYTSNWPTVGGRKFVDAYGSSSDLYSFNAATMAAKGVTEYQWRAPGEWFAEVYQVYYAEQENDPNAAVGGILRSRDPTAASMMTNYVDQGHSPQEVRPAAGTASTVNNPGGDPNVDVAGARGGGGGVGGAGSP
jgi:hypothetical protein